ncbi:MAG TPA: hypothetical protein VK589_24740 [Chryseolinea sp.]|nr:hypothetical protein [Chryseolinea sp.]
MDNFINAITTGVIDSIVFAVLVYLLQIYRYWKILKSKFHNKTFQGFFKQAPGDSVQTIKLSVKQNVIQFKGTGTIDNDPFEGELIMNPINLKIGEGFHYHKNSEGYGFVKVIIKDDDTFLLESPYIQMTDENRIGTIIPQAFIWRRKK